jgi:uncharacterized SAM-binding protein YcdF (DUF218 family)
MEQVDKYAKIIWDYMLMHQKVEKADAIFVLGSEDARVVDRAVELYKQGLGKYIIFSGGFGKHITFDKPEAEVFAEIAIKQGIPKEKIIIEDKATNTGENILFTKKLLEEKSLHFNSFILVQKPYMERRTYAAFKKLWPEMNCCVTSPSVSFEHYSEDTNWIHTMVGDLLRIKEYPKFGWQIPQDIPDEVWEAGQKLLELGYTKYNLSI